MSDKYLGPDALVVDDFGVDKSYKYSDEELENYSRDFHEPNKSTEDSEGGSDEPDNEEHSGSSDSGGSEASFAQIFKYFPINGMNKS